MNYLSRKSYLPLPLAHPTPSAKLAYRTPQVYNRPNVSSTSRPDCPPPAPIPPPIPGLSLPTHPTPAPAPADPVPVPGQPFRRRRQPHYIPLELAVPGEPVEAIRAAPAHVREEPDPLHGELDSVRGESDPVRGEIDSVRRGLVEPRRPPSSPQPHGHPTTNLRAISCEPAPNTPRGQHPDFGPQRTPKPAKLGPRAAEEFFRKNSYSRACPPLPPIRPTSPRPACPQPVPAPGEPVEPQPPHPKRRRISHPPARNTPEGFRAGGCEYPQKATAITCANRQSARPSPHGPHPRH